LLGLLSFFSLIFFLHVTFKSFADLEADETWKEENCRLCPHCSKPIFKVDGCNSVTCGRDASDKGGGNRQDGYAHE
jgi:hypothetical protein